MEAARPDVVPAFPTVEPAPADTAADRSELLLVRHGEGECNAAGVIGGRLGCSGLSPRGRLDCDRIAQRLAELDGGRRFDVLLSTPRRRVLECAQIIGIRLATPVVVIDGLRGQEFGAADGQSWERVIQAFGGPPMHDPDRPIADGAESWRAYAERVLAALTAVLAEYAGRRVLLVGHGKTIGLAGSLLSGDRDPTANAARFVADHGAITQWRHGVDGWRLVLHNDCRHLGT